MKKHIIKIFMNKSINLGLSLLEKGEIVMYEFWYNYVKVKYRDKAKLCYMDQTALQST